MNKYLTITIDVEPDCTPDWHYSNPLTFRGVDIGIAQRLHPLFCESGIVPTYLLNNVVLEDPASVDVLRGLPGPFELGTHLHPEFIEPDKQFTEYAGKKGEANCCFYPPAIEAEKIRNITALFEKDFGYRPVSFRAGRYSAGLNTMESLRNNGYLVDTSVTPHVCWADRSRQQAVDFTDAPEQPYFMSKDAITREYPAGDLLQVPISIALKKRNPWKEWLVSGAGLRHPIRRNKAIWLRPWYSPAEQLIGIARQYLQTYSHKDTVVLNMMFHNVEVLPGLSPYTATEEDCRLYLQQLRTFFEFCNTEGIQGIALSKLYDVFRK
ncbi:MAG TPA: hypothetical protein VHE34_28480 [Puia sp.]|uniref:hypothetical protein n=1 Tax=Puia sp. TaxID=2045100 RepID=UPI002CB5EF8B|nr:hypothetical protein [Puia sp.]HVU99205.1 hypothetical protein [Puia sp.]